MEKLLLKLPIIGNIIQSNQDRIDALCRVERELGAKQEKLDQLNNDIATHSQLKDKYEQSNHPDYKKISAALSDLYLEQMRLANEVGALEYQAHKIKGRS